MFRVLIINLIIPIFEILLTILEYMKALPVRYRLMYFNSGLTLPIFQLVILVLTFVLFKGKKQRIAASLIFVIYILLLYFAMWILPPLYLYD
jgi:hypothetical protein